MSFTRDNISQSSSFSRVGSVTTATTPAFSVFNINTDSTNYSLGYDWGITINNTNKSLSFDYKGSSKLTITDTGFQFTSFVLPTVSALPSTPAEGTLINHNDTFKIYI